MCQLSIIYNIKERSLSHGPFRAAVRHWNAVGLPPPFFCLVSVLRELLSLRAPVFFFSQRELSCQDDAFLFCVWLHPFCVHDLKVRHALISDVMSFVSADNVRRSSRISDVTYRRRTTWRLPEIVSVASIFCL